MHGVLRNFRLVRRFSVKSNDGTEVQRTLGSTSEIEKPRVRVQTRSVTVPPAASLMHRIWTTAKEPLQPVTISDMLALQDVKNPEATLLQSALWLHTELQRRTARQVISLSQMPFGICTMPSARRIREDYVRTFRDLSETAPPSSYEAMLTFSEKLEVIYARHGTVLSLMAKAVFELQQTMAQGADGGADDLNAFLEFANVDDAFSNFLTRRIGHRLLLGHHLALLADHKLGTQSRSICGLIDRELSPHDVASDAATAAMSLCRDTYGVAPEIDVECQQPRTLPYVRDHLYYILLELLKNSCRATVERYGDAREIPSVRVAISDELDGDVAIVVSDKGSGIPRAQAQRIWSYLYTTAPENAKDLLDHIDKDSPIAGLGFGLPVSRLHARYFGGDLHMLSVVGRGTDMVLYLSRLDVPETEAEAVLPA
jgi:pyruvate dehydrogenase kinase 2/3/4